MNSILTRAKDVLQTEILGLQHVSSQLGSSFEDAISTILQTQGRIIICGMGKSGIIGKKIAASFASTGTPSFFMHPGEAFHGDLGMVKSEDVFIAISNSGETDEVIKLLPFLRDNGNSIIGVTGRPESTLAKASHHHLNIAVPKEACPLQLAPTASTTATLAMGDALTVCLMEERSFQPESFARFHPGGSLGRRLLGKVRDDMISDDLPVVESQASFQEVIHSISSGKLGLAVVLSERVTSIITDGDLRRAMESKGKDVFDLTAMDIATPNPVSISPEASIQSAYQLMEDTCVNALLVIEDDALVGFFKK
ncbi:TPA: KpsF/GutQ family sugar-phosphate isomerase [Vibrio diabolicus]|nr:KpsF/GutQ family sugar-phosphate isomerase [Vibrio alginolyticus]